MGRLIDHFPAWMEKGPFARLGSWVPWHEDTTVDVHALDFEYLGNRSGYRYASPLICKLAAFHKELTDVQMQRVDKIIQTMFSTSWQRLWDALQEEYNPIENYSMIEGETEGVGKKITGTVKSKTHSVTKSTDSVVAMGDTGDTLIPVAQNDGDSTTTQDKIDNETTEQNTENRSRTMTRSGNIGVTTSQQMLESEFELRKRHYFEQVFEDMDQVLTMPYWA